MELNFLEMVAMNNPLRKFLLKHIEFRRLENLLQRQGLDLQGAVILDAACGSGYSSQLLRDRFAPSRLVSFDLMPEQIRLSRAYPHQSLSFVGNVLSLSLKPNQFDAIFGFGFLHHVLDWKQALRELHAVLKDDGYFVFEEPNGASSEFFRKYIRFGIPKEGQFTWPEFLQAMEQTGFRLVDSQKIFLDCFQSFLFQKFSLS